MFNLKPRIRSETKIYRVLTVLEREKEATIDSINTGATVSPRAAWIGLERLRKLGLAKKIDNVYHWCDGEYILLPKPKFQNPFH